MSAIWCDPVLLTTTQCYLKEGFFWEGKAWNGMFHSSVAGEEMGVECWMFPGFLASYAGRVRKSARLHGSQNIKLRAKCPSTRRFHHTHRNYFSLFNAVSACGFAAAGKLTMNRMNHR